ncbi:uncharacterized protein BDV14DRAFT_166284 [Aspergillus stella-maris]|uniref:uncharacterized protein n=1 Tax=Aspergillus stella-maris TaxID=1810926 RepID=UPI003CCDB9E7
MLSIAWPATHISCFAELQALGFLFSAQHRGQTKCWPFWTIDQVPWSKKTSLTIYPHGHPANGVKLQERIGGLSGLCFVETVVETRSSQVISTIHTTHPDLWHPRTLIQLHPGKRRPSGVRWVPKAN